MKLKYRWTLQSSVGWVYILLCVGGVIQVRAAQKSPSFRQPIIPIGQSAAQETQEVQSIAQAAKNQNLPTKAFREATQAEVARWEQFVRERPESVWTPSLRVNLGQFYRENGRYSESLRHWQAAWLATKAIKQGEGKHLADEALAHWTRLLASLGRFETLTEVLQETKDRVLDRGPLSQMLSRTREGYATMVKSPGETYKCGVYALHNVATLLKGRDYDGRGLTREPSTQMGFTIQALSQLSERYKLGLVAVQREQGDELVVPSVVHWKENHYAAILAETKEGYQVVDPTFGQMLFMTKETINAEASGWFLVPADKRPRSWRQPSAAEQREVYGRGYPNVLQDWNDRPCLTPCPPGCAPGLSGSSSGCSDNPVPRGRGMPWWQVSEPFINLWLHDTPLDYQPALGPAISFDLSYKQRDESAGALLGVSSVGFGWNCSWLSYVSFTASGMEKSQANVFLPGGGAPQFVFNNGVAIDYISNLRLIYLTDAQGTVTSYELLFPDGSKLVYGFPRWNFYGVARYYFLSKKVDPQGKEVRFEYDPYDSSTETVRLKGVIDADGNATTIYHVDTGPNPNLISRVVDPWGRTAYLYYTTANDEALLTRITDVGGISSTIAYDNQGWPSQLTTPYGATTFYASTSWDFLQWNIDRVMRITQPGGGKHLYVFRRDSSMASSYDAGLVPSVNLAGYVSHFDNESIHLRNSFYWSPKQVPTLSTQTPENLSTNDYFKARMRHWLGGSGHGDKVDTMALEREPSADGTTQGQLTWYDHVNKGPGGNDDDGDQILPVVMARRLSSGGPTWYEHYVRDSWGRPLSITSTYGDGSSTRTYTYTYDASGNLTQEEGPSGLIATYEYDNSYHQPSRITRYVDATTSYVTTLTYDSSSRLLRTIAHPNSTVTELTYYANNRLNIRQLRTSAGVEINRETFTYYANGLINTHIDERGLTRTFYWDNLQRPTSIGYSSGGSESFNYTLSSELQPGMGLNILDPTSVTDRLGNTTSFTYNGLRQRTSVRNPRNFTTSFAYCACGALESITDALNQTTSFINDDAGRLITVSFPGNTTRRYRYNLLGQVTDLLNDSGAVVASYAYNNQGLVATVSNPSGQTASVSYDALDRPTTITVAGGPTVTLAYDRLGRITSRSQTGGGTETFGYSADGLIRHTNALSQVTQQSYDLANRRVTITNPANQTTQMTYNSGGDLASLIDAKNQLTTWSYDVRGNAVTKNDISGTVMSAAYDDNGRLSSRSTPAKGTTYFSYDQVGNLTSINYPNSPDISYAYDALNRLASMTDSTGTTAFSYTPFGALAQENPPLANDTVDYSYDSNRRRSRLSLAKPDGSAWIQDYSYDAAWRVQSISSPAGAFTYSYSGASSLVSGIALPNGSALANSFDGLARLTSTALNHSSGSTLNVHSYLYDNLHQRTRQSRAGNYVDYGYDAIGQLTSASGRESNGTLRRHEQLSYSYDPAGNLTQRGLDALSETLAVGSRNQLSSGSYSGSLTVAGLTGGAVSSLSVNGQAASLYSDGSFAVPGLSFSSGSYTASAQGSAGNTATDTIYTSFPGSLSFSYDSNGNMTWDGQRSFSYDDDNQLIQVTTTGMGSIRYEYDGLKRRRYRREFNNNGTYIGATRYLYDGMLVIQERDWNEQSLATYTRGLDLSGSLSGAGGIGGLLARTDNAGHAYYHSDGSGNVTMLVNSSQQVVAKYLYDPFGNLLGSSGSLAQANTYRFSSKEYDPHSALYYYGFRYYEPNLQRWINQDPLGEAWGINLYGFADSAPLNSLDAFGLAVCRYPEGQEPKWGLIGPAAYVYGETGFERYVTAPVVNTISTIANIPAALSGFMNFAGEKLFGDRITTEALLVYTGARYPMRMSRVPCTASYSQVLEGVRLNKLIGDISADAIASRQVFALREVPLESIGGKLRIVDILTIGGKNIAIESKVGEVFLSGRIRQEVARDWWLMRRGTVDKVVWEFTRSPITGKGGPDPQLLETLRKLGIGAKIHQ